MAVKKSMAKKKPTIIDKQSVLNAGYGPLSAKGIANKVASGQLKTNIVNGKTVVTNPKKAATSAPKATTVQKATLSPAGNLIKKSINDVRNTVKGIGKAAVDAFTETAIGSIGKSVANSTSKKVAAGTKTATPRPTAKKAPTSSIKKATPTLKASGSSHSSVPTLSGGRPSTTIQPTAPKAKTERKTY